MAEANRISFEEQAVIVTGAGRGLGRAVAGEERRSVADGLRA